MNCAPPCTFAYKDGAYQKGIYGKVHFFRPFYTACYPGFPYLPGANTNFQVCRLSSFRCVIDIIIRNAHFQCSIEFQIDYNASFLKKNVDLVVLLCLVADTAESQCSDR